MNFLELEYKGKTIRLWAELRGGETWIHYEGHSFVYEEKPQASRSKRVKKGNGELISPIPGKIIKIYTKSGESVEVGQVVLVIEAMKMEYRICADISGRLEELFCQEGDQVSLGQKLAQVKGEPSQQMEER